MSNKKTKDKKDAQIDYQLATKNLQYTIVIKDTDIDRLKNNNNEKNRYILSLEDEVSLLKKNAINAFELEKKYRKALVKNEKLEKELEEFNNQYLEQQKKHEEEKNRMEKTYKSEINHLRLTMDRYIEKVKTTNQLLIEKEELEKELENANVKNKEIIAKNEENIRTIQIRNGLKFTNLKKKMSESIQKTKNKVTELNIQYMDISTKLTMLQNQQLFIQIEYLTQQVDDLKEKIKDYERQIYDLTKEIEIHKGVEMSLAEKNKTLNLEMEKSKISIQSYAEGLGDKMKNKTISIFNSNKDLNLTQSTKNNNVKTENNYCIEEDKNLGNKIYRKTISFNNIKYNNNSNFNSYINNSNSGFNSIIVNNNNTGNSYSFNNINNEHSRIILLEKRVIDLEKLLNETRKEYNDLKEKNTFTDKILQNYKSKYNGLFTFLEECLKNFFNDEELKSNKEIYINMESLQKGDFSSLKKEEKYSTLIILMKYLMPLMNTKNIDNNSTDHVNIKYYEFNKPNKIISFSTRKKKNIKKYIMNTTNNFYNTKKKVNKIINTDKNENNEYNPSLPSIKKISKKIALTENQLLISSNLNKNNIRNYSTK